MQDVKEIQGRKTDFVIQELERLILDDVFKQGERLPAERELMTRFGVGRNAIREAIASLSRNGMLITRPRHRPIVAPTGYETAIGNLSAMVQHFVSQDQGYKHLFDSRVFVELGLCRYAALNARKDDIIKLKKALEENRLAMKDPQDFYRTDILFHKILYEIPKNPIFPALHNAYVSWLSGHWPKMKRGEEINRITFSGHEAIYNAIVDRDPDAAEKALQTHLQIALEHIKYAFSLNKNNPEK